MKLSANFTLNELSQSSTAQRLGIDNTPTPEHISNMRYLCVNVLERIRGYFKRPIIINSCYRSVALNKAIGGVATSQHTTGQAADIEIKGVSNKAIADYIAENIIYDQVILEFFRPDEGSNSGWVHVSVTKDVNRRQKLVAKKDGAKTVYQPVKDFDPDNNYELLA